MFKKVRPITRGTYSIVQLCVYVAANNKHVLHMHVLTRAYADDPHFFFQTGARQVMQPRSYLIDLGLENVVRTMFTNPQLVDAWRRIDRNVATAAPGSYVASPEYHRLRQAVKEPNSTTFPMDDKKTLLLEIMYDGANPFVTGPAYTTGLLGVRLILNPEDKNKEYNGHLLAINLGPKEASNLTPLLDLSALIFMAYDPRGGNSFEVTIPAGPGYPDPETIKVQVRPG